MPCRCGASDQAGPFQRGVDLQLSNWLTSVRDRLSRADRPVRRARRSPLPVDRRLSSTPSGIESLEQRTLLTVQAFAVGTELFVVSDTGDSIAIRADSSLTPLVEVVANGVPVPALTPTPAGTLTKITIAADNGNNVIDLSGITTAAFSSSVEIIVDGGDGDDTLTGSADIGATLNGNDGADVITGGAAGDLLNGGNGMDVLSGGLGVDTINGGDGADAINGDEDGDVLNGGSGNDTINGNDGNDLVDGGAGTDSLLGGLGDDTLDGGSNNDSVFGEDGNDSLIGNTGNDLLEGGAGNDTLLGNAGRDSLFGQADNDSLNGGGGADSLNAGDGNDTANGALGHDTVIGGSGDDTVFGGGGHDLLFGDGDGSSAIVVGADRILGNAGNDSLHGEGGADYIDGGEGDDLITTNDVTASVVNTSVTEGNPGDMPVAVFTITLNDVLTQTATIAYQVTADGTPAGGTATDGVDFVGIPAGPTSIVTFLPGETTKTVSVSILPDLLDEPGETFLITLLSSTNVSILDDIGQGTIIDDDGGLTVTPTNDVVTLTNTVVGTGAGIVVTGMTLSGHSLPSGELSTGTFLAGVPAPYGLFSDGIVLSTGDVADYGAGPDLDLSDTFYGVPATPAQEALLDPITDPVAASFDHNDVTQFDITFDLMPGFDTLFFNLVFGSEEFPFFVGLGFNDGFGIYLNGTNVAVAGTPSAPINIDHPDFAPIPGTELNGVLAPGGDPLITFSELIGDGATGNTITFILADTFDDIVDTTIYITSLGATPPAPPPPPPPPPPIPQASINDTLRGGTGNDTIRGSIGDDIIDGQAGNDSLAGGGGMDTLVSGPGDDTLDGGRGDDDVTGEEGNNTLSGGEGSDTILLEPFADSFNESVSTTGADTVVIRGTANADTFLISQNADELMVVTTSTASIVIANSVSTVIVEGMDGDDVVTMDHIGRVRPLALSIQLGEGNDTFNGRNKAAGPVPIQILGEGGDDTINGTAGGDSIVAGDGNDQVNGADGNDTIFGGFGVDTLNGQAGNDSILGEHGNDSLIGDTGNDFLAGGVGNDFANAMGGNDTLEGNEGNDTLFAGGGNDVIRGGTGNDSLKGHSGNDVITGDGGDDTIRSSTGDDTVHGGDGDDLIVTGGGRDLVAGGDGDDYINAGGGNDTVLGGDSNDRLFGGSGADIVLGGDGDDIVRGNGSSRDTVAGNEGDGHDLAGNLAGEIREAFVLSADLLAELDALE